MKKKWFGCMTCLLMLGLGACAFQTGSADAKNAPGSASPGHSSPQPSPGPGEAEPGSAAEPDLFYITVNDTVFQAGLADNPGASAWKELLAAGPLTLDMRDYGGFEKVGSLGQTLSASDSHITTQAGDIVLYQKNQIVMFYGSNSWSYTRLGSVTDLSGWADALAGDSIRATFSLEKPAI